MDEPFYAWSRSIPGILDLVVSITVTPKVKETTGSLIGNALLAGLSGVTGSRNFKYSGEFLRLDVYRDGELIEPLVRGRRLHESAMRLHDTFYDEAYGGFYKYDPEDFMTGNAFRFVLSTPKSDSLRKSHDSRVFKSNSKMIRQIQQDFREVLGDGVEYWEQDFGPDYKAPGTGIMTVSNQNFGFTFYVAEYGIGLTEVLFGTPAYEAGLRIGDVVTKIDDNKSVTTAEGKTKATFDLNEIVKNIASGKTQESSWTVLHRDETRTILVTR